LQYVNECQENYTSVIAQWDINAELQAQQMTKAMSELTASIDNNLDPPTVLHCIKEYLLQVDHQFLLHPAGEGAMRTNRGTVRRRENQLLLETVSLPTLRSTLMIRGEQDMDSPTKTLMSPTR
jgi:streptomycin 6-kinase